MWPNGQNSVGQMTVIDIQNNPAGNPIPASVTIQNVRIQYRFRATGPDASGGRNSDGMVIDDVTLTWDPCDVNACTPGFIATDLTRPVASAQGKSPEDLGMKPPAEGTKSALYLLFGSSQGSGHYYGSDALRSPIDRYRSPGSPAYTGED